MSTLVAIQSVTMDGTTLMQTWSAGFSSGYIYSSWDMPIWQLFLRHTLTLQNGSFASEDLFLEKSKIYKLLLSGLLGFRVQWISQ